MLGRRLINHFLVGASALVIGLSSSATCPLVRADDETSRPDRLTIHEWGTFTSLQDEEGRAIRGINGDDEPVPHFVHRIANLLIIPPRAEIPIFYQGAPACHPDVTMRLETPVVYFHPSRRAKLPIKLDVEVAFRSGWLSEYYPEADVEAPGVTKQQQFGPIRKDTVGVLRWKSLSVGTSAAGPPTSAKVWLTPREVESAKVTTAGNESEQFLFYRGVGHVDSPVRVVRDEQKRSLRITARFQPISPRANTSCSIRQFWLVDVRDDKQCAFREVRGAEVPADEQNHEFGEISSKFESSSYGAENLTHLIETMRTALVSEGLFGDEADALLNTWKLSYFQSPGLRLFYLVPRQWTDQTLPLRISADADVVRVMVGRVELVTAPQRQLLQQIAAGPASKPVHDGPLADDFRAYERLGRFRNALLLDEFHRRPTAALRALIKNYGLQGYRWPTEDEAVTDTAK